MRLIVCNRDFLGHESPKKGHVLAALRRRDGLPDTVEGVAIADCIVVEVDGLTLDELAALTETELRYLRLSSRSPQAQGLNRRFRVYRLRTTGLSSGKVNRQALLSRREADPLARPDLRGMRHG